MIAVVWAGATTPFPALAALDLQKRYGIAVGSGGNILPAMAAYKQFPGMEGATYYYFGIPKNPVNEWLVANHYSRFKTPPRRPRQDSAPSASKRPGVTRLLCFDHAPHLKKSCPSGSSCTKEHLDTTQEQLRTRWESAYSRFSAGRASQGSSR